MSKPTKSFVFAAALLGMPILAVAAMLVLFDHANAALPAQPASKTHSIELVSQLGGSFKAVASQGEFAYAAIGPRFAVLDVSNTAQPTLMGQTGVLFVDIQALAAGGGYVYAAAGSDGLYVFDTSNPTAPAVATNLDLPGFASSIVVSGTHVFLSTTTGLYIVNVSQPVTPEMIGSYPAAISDFAVSGGIVYLALGDKLRILDISDPTHPSLIIDYIAPAGEVEIESNLAYVGHLGSVWGPLGYIYYGILRILDVSNPSNISEVFFSGDEFPSTVPSQLRDMKLLNHKLYGYSVSCGRPSSPCSFTFGGVDVSNPISPTLAFTSLYTAYSYSWDWRDFAVAEQRVYLATTDILRIIDTHTSAEQGQYVSWSAYQVTVANSVAYVAARSAGLLTVDVSVPEHARLMDAYTTTVEGGGSQPAQVPNIAVYGPYVYAKIIGSGVGLSRVDILDVSTSADIQRVNSSEWDMFPIRIHNGFGYYFDEYIGTQLRGIDLSVPTQPTTTLGSAATTIIGPKLALNGYYAYVAGEYEGLHIIKVVNPQNYVDVKRLAGPVPAFLAESADDALYIFTDQALNIYDLSNPENPVESSSTTLANPGMMADMEISKDLIYLAQNGSTLRVFHTPNLISTVSEVVSYTLPYGEFYSIDVAGDLVYMASPENGLWIVRHAIRDTALDHRVYTPVIANQFQPLPAGCTIAYRTHMQDRGWLEWVDGGSVSGSAGAGLQVEAIELRLCSGLPEDIGVSYQAHVQEIGWMDWTYDGQTVGTTGQGKRLEAVRFKLLNAPSGYHITYRVYVAGSGWTGLAADGEMAGTTGQMKRIEAIEINLVQP